jgi:hypothetical protein
LAAVLFSVCIGPPPSPGGPEEGDAEAEGDRWRGEVDACPPVAGEEDEGEEEEEEASLRLGVLLLLAKGPLAAGLGRPPELPVRELRGGKTPALPSAAGGEEAEEADLEGAPSVADSPSESSSS